MILYFFFLQNIEIAEWRHVAPFAIRSAGSAHPSLAAGNQVLSAAFDDGPWAWTLVLRWKSVIRIMRLLT